MIACSRQTIKISQYAFSKNEQAAPPDPFKVRHIDFVGNT